VYDVDDYTLVISLYFYQRIFMDDFVINWWKLGIIECCRYYKVKNSPFLVIGEKGDDINLVEKSDRVLIPRFEVYEESADALTAKIADCAKYLILAGLENIRGIGRVYGLLNNLLIIVGENDKLIYAAWIGLGYTVDEFNPREQYLSQFECEQMIIKLPYKVSVERPL
jgi:hypothetical protein